MSWIVEIKLRNNLNKTYTLKIPKGQIFENKKICTGLQNVAAVKDYTIVLPPHSSITEHIEVFCINRHLSSPSGSYNLTYFKINKNFQDQQDLWSLMKP